eukprot:TRINITY_DN108031_c0_g1_i1.p1 TRINITY_DN108031_c0_g1~~TRINITY_DN108031_c0_g1_i1.p1  ORF type:complete len:400 (-),score=87.32 TRINITY_DN108031_c0_g1_i1:17-1168(-)
MSYQYVDAAGLPSESRAARDGGCRRACLQGFLVLTLAAALLVVLVQPPWETSHDIASLAAAALAAKEGSAGREDDEVALPEASSMSTTSPHLPSTSVTSTTPLDALDSNKSSAGDHRHHSQSTTSHAHGSSTRSVQKQNQTRAGLPLLYCLAVALPDGHHPKLLQELFERHLGIFACDGYEVYSIVSSLPGADFPVRKMGGYSGGEDGHLSAGTLLQVMKAVVTSGRYIDFDWTVKADPETVFLPPRLQHLLAVRFSGEDFGSAAFLETCRGSSSGSGSSAFEVISATALGTFEFGEAESCDPSFGDSISMHSCLQQLDIKKVAVDNLLSDASCEGSHDDRDCTGAAVAFHPFEEKAEWLDCFAKANASEPSHSNSELKSEQE